MLIKSFPTFFYQTLSSYSKQAESVLGVGVGGRDPTVNIIVLSLGMEEIEARHRGQRQPGRILTELRLPLEHILLTGLV